MAKQIKYALCLIWLGMMSGLAVNAQFSEEDLIKEADALFDSKRYAEAMPLYSQLLSLNPTNPVFNYKYGATALYGDAEKKEEAVKYLKFAAGKPQVDVNCWYFLGRAYHLNYLFKDAVSSYEKFKSLGSGSDIEALEVDLLIEMANNGMDLLSNIKEIKVLDRKLSPEESFFRIYDLSDIGGKILVTPEELLSSEDKKRNHRSLIHFRGTGTTVYFSSYGKTGKNGLDIYRADVLPDGTFSEPVPVQGLINTPYDENYPYLHPDDRTFYFCSKGHESMGGYDVFKASFDPGTGVFSSPVNLDFAVNTPDDDLFYLADSLNKMAHFASSRSSKQGELYVYKVLVESAPLDVTLIKGSFLNEITADQKLAKITVVDASTNKEVDVQYSDPATGDYVLSFSKGGRYKFLVEVKNGNKVHAGLVDVPSGKGTTAYLQEMKLISSAGVEKLLINNLFDKTYDGDVLALAQKLLRQRAALDVNFDPTQNVTPQTEDAVEKDPALAYSDAGFGAGMSNELILEEAEARVEELKDRKIRTAQLAAGAAEASEAYFALAQREKFVADSLLAEAEKYEGEESDRRMYLAGLAKLNAVNALRRARNGKILKEEMEVLLGESEKEYLGEKSRVDSLREAIDSGSYDEIYSGLLRERDLRSERDRVEDQFDPVNDFRRKGLKSENDAQVLMDKALALREEEERIQSTLITKRRQAEKLKGKDKQKVEEEIAVLEADLESLKRKAERAFGQAEDARELAFNELERYDLLLNIDDREDLSKIDSFESSTINWSAAEATLIQDDLSNLAINEDQVAAYVSRHPEVLTELEEEGLAMQFKQSFIAEAGSESLIADGVSPDLSSKGEGDGDPAENVSSELSEELDAAEAMEEEIEDFTESMATSTSKEEAVDYSKDYDPTLSPEKRIEAEELKIKAASDWIAIIDESIEQLNSGMGGEDGVEEQLAGYESLKAKKQEEISERRANIELWKAELGESTSEEAVTRALADVDTLSPSLVARLESKIDDFSSEIATMKSVSLIDRNYLPALAEIELSGLSAPEIAQKRIVLNESLIADLDNILAEGIMSDISEDEILEMRRVKALEIRQDEEIIAGKEEYRPRTVEAREYADLLNEETQEMPTASPSEDLSEFSPEIAKSLDEDYSKNMILPDYESLIEEAELTASPELAAAQRVKVREDFLLKLSEEIALFKLALETTENPNPQVLERYNMLLTERSNTIDELNADIQFLEGKTLITEEAELTSLSENYQAEYDGFIDSLESASAKDIELASKKLEMTDSLSRSVERDIDELVALLDNPTTEIDRDLIQKEIQELQAFENSLADVQKETESQLKESEEPIAEAFDGEDSENESEPEVIGLTRDGESPAPSLAAIDDVSERLIRAYRIQGEEISSSESGKAELKKLSALNAEFVAEIQLSIDSLENVDKSGLTDREVALIATELNELDALAADKLQESDRLKAELELGELAAEAEANVTDQSESDSPGSAESSKTELPEITGINAAPDVDGLQYKSLNASIIRNGLKQKSDSTEALLSELNQLPKGESKERSTLINEINRINAEISEGIERSNLAEIDYLRSENERLLANVDPDRSTRREEIIDLQKRNRSLFEDGTEGFQEDMSRQREMIQELSGINSELTEIAEEGEQVFVPDSELASVILTSSSHEKGEGRTYMTVMQEKVESDMSLEERERLIEEDEILQTKLDFITASGSDEKGELIRSNTKVDDIGLELLLETPVQFDYLATAIKADSLKSLERSAAEHAEILQNRSIELSSEAERLMKIAPGQDSKKDQAIVEARAEKLMAEAEVTYKRSALAAGQAEFLRQKRMDEERKLSTISSDLTFRERKALNDLLLKPGYTVVAPTPEEEVVEEPVDIPVSDEGETSEEARPISGLEESDDLSEIKGNWLSLVEVIAEKKDFSDVEETMFAEADKPLYSDDNRIPIDPAMPDGLIFQVQVGAYRNPIPQDLFGAYAPIMGQQLDNGIVRYRAGLFRQYKQALQARDEIRSKGYSDAFVVAYVDGERLTGAQARAILDQAREKEAVDPELLAGSLPDKAETEAAASTEKDQFADYYNDPEAAEAEQVEVLKGLFYTVQVGVYSKPVKLGQLFNLTELNSELTASGFIRYTTGRFTDLSKATERKGVARDKGVTDAFITAYYNGKRISLEEARELIDTQGEGILLGMEGAVKQDPEDQEPVDKPKKTYVVIMGSFGSDLPQELADLFLEQENWAIRKVDGGNGTAMYMSEELNSLDEAEKLLRECQTLGVKTAIIGEMEDGKIVSTMVK